MGVNGAIVFGGGSDMGPAILKSFQFYNMPCTLISRDEADVNNYNAIRDSIKKYKPQVVINLAGVSNLQPLLDSDRMKWEEEIFVNLIGSYNVARAVMGLGIVSVFIASVAGKYGKPLHSGYSASKAGVISLVQSMAMEGEKAYCISPGRVNTKMREKDFPGEDPKTRLDPEEIADVIQSAIFGEYPPGTNVIIRKKGFEKYIMIDDGEPWKSYLNVGGKVFK